ncbi:hypothetical protein CsSME_00053576 [Camellia sinensis var. sinensis]
METTSALSISGIVLLENRSATSLSLIGIISLCTLLTWITTLHDLWSWFLLFFQSIVNFLFTAWHGQAKGKHTRFYPGVPFDSDPDHVDEDDNNVLISIGEVEVVMEKLGIFYEPSCDDVVGERLGSDDVAALFDEGEGVSLEEGKEAFGVFDENCDGFIDASELERVLCKLGFTEVSQMECQKMIASFDDNGDGLIDFREFLKLLEDSSW